VITGKVTPIMLKRNVKVFLASHRVVGSVFALAVFGEFLLGYVIIRTTKSKHLAESCQQMCKDAREKLERLVSTKLESTKVQN
jgi:hypothetical protein